MIADKSKGIFLGGSTDLNRTLVDSKNTRFIILNHCDNKRDSLYERDGGLNHVICKLANDKGITFIIDFSQVLAIDLKERAKILSRISQNVFLINKFHNNLRVVFPKVWDKLDFEHFLLAIGFSTSLIKNSLND